MKAVGRPVFATLRGRTYAAAAQQATQSSARNEVQVSKTPNGAVLASLENSSRVARISLFVNAGPRYENPSEQGICHFLRHCAGLTTLGVSKFGISKHMQQMGANFTCSTTRENMIYTVECTKDKLDKAMEIVRDVVCRPRFFPWELEDISPALKLDLALLAENPQAQLVEALHKAAYRDGLGNSLFMPSYKIGSFDEDAVLDFYLSRYVDSNMTFVGLGPSHRTLSDHAKKFKTVGIPVEQPRGSGYHGGGEIRVQTKSDFVNVAVVTEGASMDSADIATLSVLQQVMGTTPAVKYSLNNSSSRVGRAAAAATNNPVAVSSIMSAYSDSGLFGFQVIAEAGDADKVLRSVVAVFAEATKGNISDADVESGKARVKSAFLMSMEDSSAMLEDMGLQGAALGDVASVDQVLASIDSVTTADVNKVAKKVINGKPCMAAVGNLSNTPYLDKLFK